jgi:peroxiredoxin Q/BCP
LLADTDRRVARQYGVAAPVIGIRRSVFVVDAEGIVRYKDMKLIGATFEKADKLAGILSDI